MTHRNLLLLGLSAIALQGCIAAAAIPIVAGSGALVRDSVSDDARTNRRERVTVVPTAPVPAPAPTPAPALALETASEEPLAADPDLPEPVELAIAEPALPPVPGAPRPTPEPTPVAAPASTPAPAPAPVEEALVSAEPPAQPPAAASAAVVPGQPMDEGYGALRRYTLATLGGGLPLSSAMLADPTSLQPIRRQCEGNTPTMVIDLDPAGGLVPLAGPLALNSALGRVLDELRSRDVQIAWITDRGPIDARAVRDRLVAAGLDPASQDAIYVERYPGETKQARRAALAQTQCVIALAGDERSDFDDLFDYIIDSEDARSLDPLLGNGWFLIDNPVGP